jgi:hypothetical protein
MICCTTSERISLKSCASSVSFASTWSLKVMSRVSSREVGGTRSIPFGLDTRNTTR